MNEGLNTEVQQKNKIASIIDGLASGIIRVVSVLFWCFIYIGFIWFLDYRTGFEKLIGFTTLIMGAVGVFTPVKAVGQKYWLSIMGAFYACGFVLLAIF